MRDEIIGYIHAIDYERMKKVLRKWDGKSLIIIEAVCSECSAHCSKRGHSSYCVMPSEFVSKPLERMAKCGDCGTEYDPAECCPRCGPIQENED